MPNCIHRPYSAYSEVHVAEGIGYSHSESVRYIVTVTIINSLSSLCMYLGIYVRIQLGD